MRAFGKIQEEFLNTLLVKTDEIRDIGRAIIIEFNLDENAKLTFNSKLPSNVILTRIIEKWVKNNAFKGRTNLAGTSAKLILFDEVRIPLMDQETNKPYNPSEFGDQIINYLEENEVQAVKSLRGQNLTITII